MAESGEIGSESPPGEDGSTPPSHSAQAAVTDVNPSCVFCKICSKKAPAEVVYEDSEYVCFVDRKPASTHHYLVVPRTHIEDSRELTSSHTAMVERMAAIGQQVLEERGGRVEEARLGFHWPPFVFVKHLHLHVVSPESGMGWLNRTVIFRKESYFFTSPTYLINYLKSKKSKK